MVVATPTPLLRLPEASIKKNQHGASSIALYDTFRRSISAPTDNIPEEDRRFVRSISHLRESLDETSTNLHATTFDDDDWGWFEDTDDHHVVSHASAHPVVNHDQIMVRSTSLDESKLSLYASEIQPQRQVWKTFPPLSELLYEPCFASSGYAWLAQLSSTRPLAARIQVRSFRIVEGIDGYDRHAEYCVQCWIGDASTTVWKRFAAFKRFAYSLKTNGSRRTLRAWSDVLARSTWFRSLDVAYLHQMCCLLETFAQVLLLEAHTPYLLARLLAAE
ncbi:unnamed protein product [Aphanomyces euteiches]|uniref:PX domain-containing protein n=1 Tax=Aphanomyces euteiches TaxID=100861 RepID=A0A6G0XQD8_9STRA|nr:hypothetical protein Ae201684_002433 [Aphanomyces euteiches]KAH9086996.1 hypothetical protein Ae201684P_000411 [Aphanomyces euteiches]KAH9132802.1 hypothetical protein AeRB84_020866 [Aphanomyces euteiches]